MSNIIDLHTHTIKSDGELTPNELLEQAEKIGIKYLSITDHESVEAYYNMDYSLYSGILIPGIELRSSCNGIAIELLAYGFNIDKMKKIIKEYHYKDTEEIDDYMLNLAFNEYKRRNIKVSETFIKDYDKEKFLRLSSYIKYAIKQYPENQYLLENLPHGKSFFRYCITNPESPLFLNLTEVFPSVSELILSIKKAGGFISVPHVFSYREHSKKILNTLLKEYEDIDAIEAYHSSFSLEQNNYLLEMAKRYNKYITGGSDFHGIIRPSVKLGSGDNNNLNIPEQMVKRWVSKLNYIIKN